MKTTWVEFDRKPGETDEEWAAVCKEMAAFLQAQAIEAATADETPQSGSTEGESAVRVSGCAQDTTP